MALRAGAYLSTASIIASKYTKKLKLFSDNVSGSYRFTPLSVDKDQLQCLPEPLTFLKGFSCKSATMLCLLATFFIISIVIWFWSTETFAVLNIRAISNWFGATSLCLVLDITPTFQSSLSSSAIKLSILSLIVP